MLSGAADTVGGQRAARKVEKKESREKYSLCAGGVDWRVVGDEEGEGGGGRKLQSTAILLYSASGATR